MLKENMQIILLFCFIFLSHHINAQFSRFGVRASISSVSWVGDYNPNPNVQYNSKIGGSIGFYFAREIGTNWNIEYGLNLSVKGFNLTGQVLYPGAMVGVDIKNQSAYIDVPVGFRYYFGRAAPNGFFIKAGIGISFLVYNKVNWIGQYNNQSFNGDFDGNASELNRFDFFVFPGIGYQLANGLNFQLIWERGLINIVKDDEYFDWTKAYNQSFKLVIGFDL
ncbi:MAG: hypothetical protein DRI54_06135 [Bacteroidetes bacterium]|nr:MAG: hypothetical protein DRI54_06135 [Bacteroidota bacterium]